MLVRKLLGGFALLGVALFYAVSQQADSSETKDYFLLSLSWVPSWCEVEGDARNAAQCDTGAGWQVHGLWPQYADGGWPEYCETDARDPSRAQTRAMADIMGEGGYAWHQWKKHGRCSGLSADAYFAATRHVFERLAWPADINSDSRTIRANPDTIERAFRDANPDYGPDMLVATCRKGNLQELRLCLDSNLRPRNCGTDVLESACRAREVSLPAPR